jgi:hypothetical protein
MRSIVRAVLYVLATIGTWLLLYLGWIILGQLTGSYILDCDEGTDCGAIANFTNDTMPLVPLLLLVAATLTVRFLGRRVERAVRPMPH